MRKREYVAMVLIAIAAVSLVLAGLANMGGSSIMGVGAEGFSRACTNVALITIALGIWFKEPKDA